VSTKTISLKLEAYERLRAARRYPTESFSEVVLRATWPEDTITASDLLALHRTRRVRFSNEELDRIEALERGEAPSEEQVGQPLVLETSFLIDLEREHNRGVPGPAVAFLETHEDARLYITFTVAGELAAGVSLADRARWEEFSARFTSWRAARTSIGSTAGVPLPASETVS